MGGTTVAPAVPVTPTPPATPPSTPAPPATPTPTPTPTPPATPPAAPTPPPAAPPATPPVDSPPAAPATDQRVADAQREMHRATTEASQLRRQLDSILSDPELGPLARSKVSPPATPTPVPVATPAVSAPPADSDPRLLRAWEEYQRAPNDQAAFFHLVKLSRDLGKEDALSAVESREIEQANQARQHQTTVAIAQTINAAVAQEAPDVDLEIFWTFGRRAQAETPSYLTDRASRIEWQKTRMVELARAKQQGLIGPAVQAALEAAKLQATAGVSMPGGGGTPPPAPPAAPGAPKSFVDQAKAARAWPTQ